MEITIKIPEGIEAELNDEVLKVKGPLGEVEKRFYRPKISLKKDGNGLVIKTNKDTKKLLATLGTWRAHINNMFYGVTKGFEYKMEISHVHFPMTVSIDGNKILIKNFLGQKETREAKILDGVEIKINGNELTIKGIDKEKVGQTAGNIEQATKLFKRRDRRVFSDGIYITSKGEKQ